MADAKVSALTALTGANVAADDKLYIVDTSATTSGSKSITVAEFEAKALADMASLTAITDADTTDVLPIIDDPTGTPVGKKITVANLQATMMADVVGLTELTSADASDIFPVIDDPSGTPIGKKITVASLRESSLPTNTTYIPPSGTDDTTAIQTALTAGKRVLLSGVYIVRSPLTLSTPAEIIGVGPSASIHYLGTTTTSALITCTGSGAAVRNVVLYCYFKTRGIRFYQCYYEDTGSTIWVRDARQLALDFDSSHGATFSAFRVSGTRGMTMRTKTCNATKFRDFCFSANHLFWHLAEVSNANWLTAANNVTLWEYGSANGIAATRIAYGANCVEDWPSTSDVAEASRAAITMIAPETLITMEHVTCEASSFADYPVLYCGGTETTVRQWYLEDNYFKEAMITCPGTGTGFVGGNMLFDGITFTNKVTSGVNVGQAKWLIKATGATRNIVLNRATSHYDSLGEGFVREDGALHTGLAVTNVVGTDIDGLEQVMEDIVADP